MTAYAPAQVECVGDLRRAEALLHPLRLRILERARCPASATEIASQLRLPRQKVNYHVRQLARAGLVRRAGRRRKRNMIEQRWVATAHGYLLSPEVLGPLAALPGPETDASSAAYLLALAGRLQSELGQAAHQAGARDLRLASLGIEAELRFESAEQRSRFAGALRAAVLQAVARHSSPATGPGRRPGRGRPYRLVLGCYPIPHAATRRGPGGAA